MDALATERLRSRSLPGGRDELFFLRSGYRSPRRRAAEMLDILRRLIGLDPGQAPGTGSTLTPSAVSRRRRLLAYTAAEIALGSVLVLWTTVAWPLQPAIDAGFAGTTVLAGPTGGLLLWLVYGLLGSLRVLRQPGGARMTFHMPFIGAAMVLGGPTAGAWVAVLSTIDREELESQPWYGILSNHATLAIGAIAGGLTTQLVGHLLGGDAGGTAWLIAATSGALVLAVVSIALGAITVVLRDEVSPRVFTELLVGQVARITVIEIALVVVLAAAYAELGWWSPLLIGALVLVVWDNDPMPPPDPLTQLLGRRGYERQLEAGLGRLRRGLTPGASVLGIDLDHFNDVNNHHGHAVGDAVLCEVANRMRAHARRPFDLVARLGGDEFAMFLPGLVDHDAAMRRAEELAAAICKPIATPAGSVTIGVSIGLLIVNSWGGMASSDSLMHQADTAMFTAKAKGGGVHRYDPDEPPPWGDDGLHSRRG